MEIWRFEKRISLSDKKPPLVLWKWQEFLNIFFACRQKLKRLQQNHTKQEFFWKKTHQKNSNWKCKWLHLMLSDSASSSNSLPSSSQMATTSKFRSITSSSHVFTNPESTKPDFFFHEICRLFWSVLRIKIDYKMLI